MSRKFHSTFLAGILRDARQHRGLLRERVHSLLCDAASIVFFVFVFVFFSGMLGLLSMPFSQREIKIPMMLCCLVSQRIYCFSLTMACFRFPHISVHYTISWPHSITQVEK